MFFDEYGTIAASPYIPTDQRLEDGQGLTWRTAPLAGPLTLAGPIQLHLVATSTATDTDWVAKVADVAPDGTESIVSEGYLRASHRELDVARSSIGDPYQTDTNPTPLTPGTFDAYDLAIFPTAYQLAAGHRLQLRLTSYDLPTSGPASVQLDLTNPLATTVTPILPATNSVRLGGPDGSWLLVPLTTTPG